MWKSDIHNGNQSLQLRFRYLPVVALLEWSLNRPFIQALFATAISFRRAILYIIRSTRTMYTRHSFVSPLPKGSSYYKRARKVKKNLEYITAALRLNEINNTVKGTLKRSARPVYIEVSFQKPICSYLIDTVHYRHRK